MKEDKNIELSNSAFEIKVKWRKGAFSSQLAILIGLGALYAFSSNTSVKHLVFFGIALDILSVIFTLATSVRKTEDTDSEETKEENTAEVTHDKSRKSSVSSSDKGVRNKVPVPNQNAPRSHGSNTPSGSVAQEEPVPMEIPRGEEKPKFAQEVETDDMSNNDWEGFF